MTYIRKGTYKKREEPIKDLSEFHSVLDLLISKASIVWNVPKDKIKAKYKKTEAVKSRYAIFYYIKNVLRLDVSLKDIGKPFTGKDHSSVLYGIGEAEKMLSDEFYKDLQFQKDYKKFVYSLPSFDFICELKNPQSYNRSIVYYLKHQGL